MSGATFQINQVECGWVDKTNGANQSVVSPVFLSVANLDAYITATLGLKPDGMTLNDKLFTCRTAIYPASIK